MEAEQAGVGHWDISGEGREGKSGEPSRRKDGKRGECQSERCNGGRRTRGGSIQECQP